jgi:hypothetical protein
MEFFDLSRESAKLICDAFRLEKPSLFEELKALMTSSRVIKMQILISELEVLMRSRIDERLERGSSIEDAIRMFENDI